MGPRGQEPQPEGEVNGEVSLKRHLGFLSCVGMIIGIVIGSGIFVSPKGVLEGSGSVGMSLIIWFICGLFALLGSMACSELGSLFPNSGGTYLFIIEGFTPSGEKKHSWWRVLIPFLVSWQYNLAQKPASGALQCLTIAQYLVQLVHQDCITNFEDYIGISPTKLIAACLVILVTFINYSSATGSSKVINILSTFKIFVIAFIIIFGIISLVSGESRALSTGFEGTSTSANGIALAVYSGLWAVSGWDNLTMITKELINPKKNLLLSFVFSLGLIVTLYIMINCAYFAVLTKEEFLASDAVAVDFASRVGGKPAAIFVVVAISLTVFGSAIGVSFTNVRIAYVAGLKGHLWDFVSYLHVDKMTPVVALILNCLISLFLLSQSSILGLISLFGFIDGIVFILAMISLLIVRRRCTYDEDIVKFPAFVPIAVILFYSLISIMPFVDNPRFEYIYVLIILLIGIIVFFAFFRQNKSFKIADKLKIMGQKILNVVPPEGKEF